MLVGVGNSITIHEKSRDVFSKKVNELLLTPPEWVSLHVQTVRKTLDGIPSNVPNNYNYNPKYNYNGVRIEFECTKNNYKLTIKNETPIACVLQKLQSEHRQQPHSTANQSNESKIIYSGAITDNSISLFPSDLQSHATRLASSDFPYTGTINSSGGVTVGGTMHFGGETTDIMDLLRQIEEQDKQK